MSNILVVILSFMVAGAVDPEYLEARSFLFGLCMTAALMTDVLRVKAWLDE